MDMKEKLREYSKDISRWEKVTYREVNSGEEKKKKSVRGKRSVLFVDTSILRKMLDPVSLSANRVAYLIMDEADFGTNIYHGTHEEIHEILKMHLNTVDKAIVELRSVDFVRKIRNGRLMLNPAVGAKCYAEDVTRLHDEYAQLRPYEPKEKRGNENEIHR